MTPSKQTRHFTLCAVLVAAWGLGAPAAAQDAGWYLGGAIGESKVNAEAASVSPEDTDLAIKIFGGYQFDRNWALEAAYIDFGRFHVIGNAGRANVDVEAFALSGVGTLLLNGRFALFAKAGLYLWDSTVSGAGARGNDGLDPFIGIGARYDGDRNLGVQVEFERYSGDDKINLISVGLRYKF